MLRTDLAIKTGELEDALILIEDHRSYGDLLPFALFNLGTALSRKQQHNDAAGFYRDAIKALYKNEPITENDLALADRIHTAAGYNHLFAKRYEDAVEQFESVQLSSLDADMALLGYGRASAEIADYQAALKPWSELAQRSIIAPAAQEALLSMPIAYEKLGAVNEALSAYQHAENLYLTEIDRLQTLQHYLDDNRLEAAAILREPNNWFETRPEVASAPKARQLAELFSSNRFQTQLHEFQDINDLHALTESWVKRLDLYSDMLIEREEKRNDDLNFYIKKQLFKEIDNVASYASGLREKVGRITKERDYLSLQTAERIELQERVDTSKKRLEQLQQAGENTGKYSDSLRRYSGLLLWDAAEDFASQLYTAEKKVSDIETQVLDLRQTDIRVQNIFAEAPDIYPYQQRIAALQVRLSENQAALNTLIGKSEQRILLRINEELSTQQRRLRAYLSQTRLAIARLYDTRSQSVRQ